MRERGEELVEKCQKALELAFCSPSFELGVGGEKYELILSADGNRVGPCSRWSISSAVRPGVCAGALNILVGRQPSAGFSLQAGGAPGAGGGRAGLDRAQGGQGFPDSLL